MYIYIFGSNIYIINWLFLIFVKNKKHFIMKYFYSLRNLIYIFFLFYELFVIEETKKVDNTKIKNIYID